MIFSDLIHALPGCQNAVAVDVSSADQALSPPCRRLYIGVTGDVEVNMEGTGAAIVFKAVPVGYLDVRATAVLHASTTASHIVALW